MSIFRDEAIKAQREVKLFLTPRRVQTNDRFSAKKLFLNSNTPFRSAWNFWVLRFLPDWCFEAAYLGVYHSRDIYSSRTKNNNQSARGLMNTFQIIVFASCADEKTGLKASSDQKTFTIPVKFKCPYPGSGMCSNIMDQTGDLPAASGDTSGHRRPTHLPAMFSLFSVCCILGKGSKELTLVLLLFLKTSVQLWVI